MKREAIRVEPISSNLERWGTLIASPVTRAGNMIFVSGLPPFDPETRRNRGRADRAPDRACSRADETLSRSGRRVAGPCDEVQRLLHFGEAFSGRQFGLPALLPARPAGAHLRLHPGMDRAVRHRDRLHRHGVGRSGLHEPPFRPTVLSRSLTENVINKIKEFKIVIARSGSDEAIHSSVSKVDCFAALAMTAQVTCANGARVRRCLALLHRLAHSG